ncbi:heterogeneous nuclear ribonucleoprotein A0-like [Girardinichthys multiradiatus]|uniref:heterogeneous nuclear ribonucleoprotein A0-like n=1 Tax=Girardinichthys multiradiatus TaxID=208333 RepID=UPI001FACE2EC|nr:heterogeneous nuclear ribonucleoprotein A0-like [Girardinichthys multiradiatus]XP_047215962.1 heterogeneous nuclear ribonucleoprotein A0-like [Girardinichthys multiradiatus]
MDSNKENIEAAPQKRIFIILPKKYMAALARHFALEHGLFITELDPNISEKYLISYFKEWGQITKCKIRNDSNSSKNCLADVWFSTEEEADRAHWAGPHCIGGTESSVRRIVSPKIQDE